MLYRRTIDKQILNINDIKGLPIFSAPLFSGYSEIPRLIVKTTDDGIQLAQVGHDDHELQENEKWENIKWEFKNKQDYQKHLKEDKEGKVHYIIGQLFLYGKCDKYVKTELYVLKKIKAGTEKKVDKAYFKYFNRHRRLCNLDWLLQNWQIPIFTIIAAFLGASTSVIGNIIIEFIKGTFTSP